MQVPSVFQPTYLDPMTNETRPWLINPMGAHRPFPAWGIAFTALPALGLTFVGYMVQNLTTMRLNRKDNLLQKPPSYHLDLLVLGIFIYPMCSFLGLPFTRATPVPCLAYLTSITTRKIIGNTTKVTKVIESGRTTNMVIHVLLLFSLLFPSVLWLIPHSVLFGVFLFMGVGSIAGNRLFERLSLLTIWVPEDYPKYEYIKNVSFWSLHHYTILQFLLLVVLIVLIRVKELSVGFPFFILLLVLIRWAIGWFEFWSKEDLKWLDQ